MFQPGDTIASVLDRNRGIGPGFDLLRIVLASVIFYGHIAWLTGHVHIGALPVNELNPANGHEWGGWIKPILVSYVPAFFTLSGFLVMGSAVRTRATQTFLAFRALRIFPALAVELTLSALILGVFFTNLPLGQYLTDPAFWRYFGNLVGWVDFELPGVFVKNHVPQIVNANLWTLPAEFDCYLISAVLMFSGLLYRRSTLTVLFAILSIAFALLNGFSSFAVAPTTLSIHTITYYFFAGVLFYQWREKVPVRWSFFLVSCALSYVFQWGHHTVYLASPFVTYCTIFVGMMRFPQVPIVSSGDYSYGIYLYGCPITQAVIASLPTIASNRWAVLAVSGTITVIFAALSWHLIEKRALASKRHLPARWFPIAQKQVVALPTDRLKLLSPDAT